MEVTVPKIGLESSFPHITLFCVTFSKFYKFVYLMEANAQNWLFYQEILFGKGPFWHQIFGIHFVASSYNIPIFSVNAKQSVLS